jgi:hypothetical protein
LFNENETLANTGDRFDDDPKFAGVEDVFSNAAFENTVFIPFI